MRIALITIAVIFVSGHLTARYCAWRFGKRLMEMYMTLGRQGAEDTDAARHALNGPQLSGYTNWAQRLSFFGGHYADQIDELKETFIYCLGQLGLPEERRFAAPPTLKYLKLNTNDHSDRGVAASASDLLLYYMAHL